MKLKYKKTIVEQQVKFFFFFLSNKTFFLLFFFDYRTIYLTLWFTCIKNEAAKVVAIKWSANGRKLAIVNLDRTVLLFDETGTRRDKFTTKPFDSKVVKHSPEKKESIIKILIFFFFFFFLFSVHFKHLKIFLSFINRPINFEI